MSDTASVPATMLAAVLYGPGDLRLENRAVPAPGPDEVVIKVRSCAICGTDPKIVAHGWPGQPAYGDYIPGHEYAGTIVKTGAGVTALSVGDRVVVEPHKGCGKCENCMRGLYTTCLNYGKMETGHRHYGFTANGGYAGYAVNHVNTCHPIPHGITFDESTLATTAGTALYAIERAGGVEAGSTVAVFGPGPIGLMAVQLAKSMGAGRVIMVGTRESRLEKARQVGADRTVNSKEADPVEAIRSATGGRGADLVLECSGSPGAARQSIDAVRKSGRIGLLGIYQEEVPVKLDQVVQWNLTVAGGKAEGGWALRRVMPLVGSGRLKVAPLITHRFPLTQVHRAFEVFTGREGGAIKVIVNPSAGEEA
ncbi:MAG: zinc-binding dehydrogenase [Firmicutes bacterium]|nr:zinc-binding dehydrogenase [Bacillota bacterium]